MDRQEALKAYSGVLSFILIVAHGEGGEMTRCETAGDTDNKRSYPGRPKVEYNCCSVLGLIHSNPSQARRGSPTAYLPNQALLGTMRATLERGKNPRNGCAIPGL